MYNFPIKRSKYTDKELVTFLQNFYKAYKRTPKAEELKPSNSVYIRRFGSMRRAYQAAGIPVTFVRGKGYETIKDYNLSN